MHQSYMTRRQLVAFLNERGYPISLSTMAKLCMPGINQGPRATAFWGKRPLYTADDAIDWAEARLRPTRTAA